MKVAVILWGYSKTGKTRYEMRLKCGRDLVGICGTYTVSRANHIQVVTFFYSLARKKMITRVRIVLDTVYVPHTPT